MPFRLVLFLLEYNLGGNNCCGLYFQEKVLTHIELSLSVGDSN
jgi:hypothetical protein